MLSEDEILRLKNRSDLLLTLSARYIEMAEAGRLIRGLTDYMTADRADLPTLVQWVAILSCSNFETSIVRETAAKANKYINERSVQ